MTPSDTQAQEVRVSLADYASARARLGIPATPKPHIRRDLIGSIAPPRQERPKPEPIVLVSPLGLIGRPGWRTIVFLCALKHHVSWRDILSVNREYKVVAARYAAMRLIHTHCRLKPEMIGRLMGRDRTTVLYALGRLPARERKLRNHAH